MNGGKNFYVKKIKRYIRKKQKGASRKKLHQKKQKGTLRKKDTSEKRCIKKELQQERIQRHIKKIQNT